MKILNLIVAALVGAPRPTPAWDPSEPRSYVSGDGRTCHLDCPGCSDVDRCGFCAGSREPGCVEAAEAR